MERHGPPAAGPAVVTAADMVAGHVALDIECLDRIYLNGFVNKLQTPGGVVYFFHDHRGKPIVSPALFEPIGEKFRRDIKDWAQGQRHPADPVQGRGTQSRRDGPLPGSRRGDRTLAGRRPSAARRSSSWCGRPASGPPIRAGARSFPSPRSSAGSRCSTSTSSMSRWARGFIKICSYFPYPVKVWVNGQYAERPAMPHEAETRPVALGSRMRETAFLCRLRRPDLVACPSLWCPSPTSMEQERS